MRIAIGLTATAQAGKDEVGKYLVEKYGFTRVSFADKVRECLYALNPYVVYYSPVFKADCWISVQNLVNDIGWEEAKKCEMVRTLLQRMGTEVGRAVIDDNVWINLVREEVKHIERAVFTDIRFDNEASVLQEFEQNLIIRIDRGRGKINDHVSENGISSELIGLEIKNDSTLEGLYLKVDELMYRYFGL